MAGKENIMKAIIVNGSPRKNGNCNILAEKFAGWLAGENVEAEVLQIGNMNVNGCLGCWACSDTNKCIQKDEDFHGAAAKIYEADALMVFAPVYYDSIPSQLKSFMDRLFFQNRGGTGLKRKVGGACVVQRRVGAVSALDDIYHYMMCGEMIVATSSGENVVFGLNPGDVLSDEEGLSNLEKLAANMCWVLKSLKCE